MLYYSIEISICCLFVSLLLLLHSFIEIPSFFIIDQSLDNDSILFSRKERCSKRFDVSFVLFIGFIYNIFSTRLCTCSNRGNVFYFPHFYSLLFQQRFILRWFFCRITCVRWLNFIRERINMIFICLFRLIELKNKTSNKRTTFVFVLSSIFSHRHLDMKDIRISFLFFFFFSYFFFSPS